MPRLQAAEVPRRVHVDAGHPCLIDDASGSSSGLCGSGFQHERRHPPEHQFFWRGQFAGFIVSGKFSYDQVAL